MDIILYRTMDSENTLNKELTEVRTITGSFRDSADLVNPSLNVDINDISEIADVNYCYIPDFERYYFINRVIAYRTHIFTIYLNIDVLESYKNEILDLNGYINQQEQNINYYYDAGYVSQINKEVETFKSDVTIPNTTSIILSTIGG